MRATTRLTASALMGLVCTASALRSVGAETDTNTPFVHQWGKFNAMLQLTSAADELFAAWNRPGAGVPVITTEVARRGVPIVAVVFFSGCTPNAKRVCDAEVSFQVFKPDGSAYHDEQQSELWTGEPPSRGTIELGVGYLTIAIGEGDPSGLYTCRARLIDKVSRDEALLSHTFRVDP